VRIISGRARGLRLAEVGPGDPAAHLRPTSDKVRQAIFNLLQADDPVTGARVLDLFAGTGALGLEALSRGAMRVAFVDDGAVALGLIRANVGKMRAEDSVDILRRDATRLGVNGGAGYGLVFLDPPYGKGLGEAALGACVAGGWLAPGAVVVWEDGAPPVAPPRFVVTDQRRYGDTVVTLLRAP
jgi:16S rRNA (guanine966-N2)-methyltransferase